MESGVPEVAFCKFGIEASDVEGCQNYFQTNISETKDTANVAFYSYGHACSERGVTYEPSIKVLAMLRHSGWSVAETTSMLKDVTDLIDLKVYGDFIKVFEIFSNLTQFFSSEKFLEYRKHFSHFISVIFELENTPLLTVEHVLNHFTNGDFFSCTGIEVLTFSDFFSANSDSEENNFDENKKMSLIANICSNTSKTCNWHLPELAVMSKAKNNSFATYTIKEKESFLAVGCKFFGEELLNWKLEDVMEMATNLNDPTYTFGPVIYKLQQYNYPYTESLEILKSLSSKILTSKLCASTMEEEIDYGFRFGDRDLTYLTNLLILTVKVHNPELDHCEILHNQLQTLKRKYSTENAAIIGVVARAKRSGRTILTVDQ